MISTALYRAENHQLKTSEAGREMIKTYEGLRLTAYRDVGGRWTIGYGDTSGVYPGLQITRDEAETRLIRRLTYEFEPGVIYALSTTQTTQNQFDALVSLAYNIGVARFQSSSVASNHRAANWNEAAKRFLLYDVVAGRHNRAVHARRLHEAALYLGRLPARLV